MNRSTRKIIGILQDVHNEATYRQQYENDINYFTSAYLAGITSIWLENSKELQKHRIYSDELPVVAALYDAQDFNISEREITDAILCFVSRNLEAGILDKNLEIKGTIINSSNKKDILDIRIIGKAINSITYYDSYKAINEGLINKVRSTPSELYTLTSLSEKRISEVREYYQILKEHYFLKTETYDTKDITIIITALKNLGLSEEVLTAISNTLNNKITKRKLPEKVISIKNMPKKEPKKILTKKEHFQLQTELNKYFFKDTFKLINCLDIIELSKVIKIMKKLNYSETEIYTVIKNNNREVINSKINPIIKYLMFYNRLKKLKEKGYIDNVDYIESILKEMMICSAEEYTEWKIILETELEVILSNSYIEETDDLKETMKFALS